MKKNKKLFIILWISLFITLVTGSVLVAYFMDKNSEEEIVDIYKQPGMIICNRTMNDIDVNAILEEKTISEYKNYQVDKVIYSGTFKFDNELDYFKFKEEKINNIESDEEYNFNDTSLNVSINQTINYDDEKFFVNDLLEVYEEEGYVCVIER